MVVLTRVFNFKHHLHIWVECDLVQLLEILASAKMHFVHSHSELLLGKQTIFKATILIGSPVTPQHLIRKSEIDMFFLFDTRY